MCECFNIFVKNESYQNFRNICKPNLAYYTSILNDCKNLVLPENNDSLLKIFKMYKLHIFVITNMCKPIFVTFGRIGARCRFWNHPSAGEFYGQIFVLFLLAGKI
jgi:hypothetical protein